jgi:CheY-like chemotaxis protein
LAWGAAKARSIVGPVAASGAVKSPRVAVAATVRAEREQIEQAVGSAGFETVVIRNPAALDEVSQHRPPSLAFVDLAHPLGDQTIRSLAARDVKVVAFGDAIDDFATVRASALGARHVLERSRFLATIDDYIPGLA